MGGGHTHSFVRGEAPSHTFVHHIDARVKIVATVLFVFAVVATPRTAVWAFALHLIVVAVAIRTARLSFPRVARRLVLEAPFVAFALFLPLIGRGERIHVLGISLSVAGLWASWNILVKGSLGVMAAVVLAETTAVRDLLVGLERLRMPAIVVQVTSFMVRYGEVLTGEMQRMKIARISRGYDPRWIWQARAIAAAAGALFIRSYERGERVYLAMQSRGYEGHLPDLQTGTAEWMPAMVIPAAAAVITVIAWAA